MNSDYERYDFWFRETVQVKEEGYKVIDEFKNNTTKVKNVKELLLEIHNKYILPNK